MVFFWFVFFVQVVSTVLAGYFFGGWASFLSTHNNLKKKTGPPTSLIVLANANAAGLITMAMEEKKSQ